MEIAETTIFTKGITRILTDDEYRELQNFLVAQPKTAAVIRFWWIEKSKVESQRSW